MCLKAIFLLVLSSPFILGAESPESKNAFLNCVADEIPQDLGSVVHDFVGILDIKNGPFIDIEKVDRRKLEKLCK